MDSSSDFDISLYEYAGKNPVKDIFGGDEFVFSLPLDSTAQLEETCEKLRAAIEEHEFSMDHHRVKVTASIGGAWIFPEYQGGFEHPLKVADQQLYKSKHAGRNTCHTVSLLDSYKREFKKVS